MDRPKQAFCVRDLALVLTCGLLLSGCSLFGTEWAGSDGVRATVDLEVLIVENQRPDTVWTVEIGRRIRARTDFKPTLSGEGIPPGERREVPLSDILMEENETEIIIYWWEAVVEDGERQPGEMSSFVVEIGD